MSMRRFIAAAALAAAAADSHAGTYSDLWFNPQQPGWGVQVTEQDEIAFVTFYTYGSDGKPTWFVASDAHVVAYSGSGGFPVFSGTLYKAEGTYHGAPYQPGATRMIPVGELQLEVLDRDRMKVYSTIDGVTGVREVRRFAIAQPIGLANYSGTAALRQVRGSQPFGTLQLQSEMLLHLDAETGAGFLRSDDQLGRRCEFRGPYELVGKLVRMSGRYECNRGDQPAGTFELTDLEITANGFTGYLRSKSGNDSQYGRVAAIRW